ncbi:MAG: 5-oxoprolinase subunit PxpA [Micropruina sp.]|uniref:LamB/YcsF family protein n=1 Tax=Micropruina sp. TaxID=2737536 RepID=UPI0039E580B0
MATIDLNADLGESFGSWRLGDDEAMLEIVTSANVACGFHAGDPLTLQRTCELAARRGVRIGAQVSYRDLAGFGRRFLDCSFDELRADVLYQLGALQAMCVAAGTEVAYLKPHGALYNTVVHHEAHAEAVVAAILAFDPTLPLLGLPGAVVLDVARAAGLRTVAEAFVDRGYTAAGTLVPRRQPGALIADHEQAAQSALRMVTDGVVTAVDGTEVPLRPESLCTHGDSPGAVAMARRVRELLASAGVEVKAFA